MRGRRTGSAPWSIKARGASRAAGQASRTMSVATRVTCVYGGPGPPVVHARRRQGRRAAGRLCGGRVPAARRCDCGLGTREASCADRIGGVGRVPTNCAALHQVGSARIVVGLASNVASSTFPEGEARVQHGDGFVRRGGRVRSARSAYGPDGPGRSSQFAPVGPCGPLGCDAP